MALWAHSSPSEQPSPTLRNQTKQRQRRPRFKVPFVVSEGRAHNRGRGRRRRLRARSKDLAGVVLTDGETVAPRGCRAQVAVTRPVAPCSNQIRDSREALSS